MNLSTLFSKTAAPIQHWIGRVESELRFARQLCELHPDEAGTWHPAIERAHARMSGAFASGCLDAVPPAVAEVEEMLSAVAAVAKSYTIHCVGHAHVDMNWQWSWPETVAVTLDTFSTVLRLMEEYPDFKFSQSQACMYKIAEKHRPELLEKIVERVKEGRWEVTASHWVEGDKNMAGGESLCRHLLYTRAYMQRLFGLQTEDVPIDWAPDTFGHAATMPTYLARGGVKYVYLHRPGVLTVSKPGAFWWEGPDGARVLVRNDMELGYNGKIDPETIITGFYKFVKETGGRDFMFIYGVGDHGGGPTRRDILRAMDMKTWPVFPKVEFSTARAFFERLEKQSAPLPVVCGELNTEFTGCYTTHALIKKANRLAENRLVDAELACALAWGVAGRRYPADAFTEAWRDTLFSQFHDILPGSGIHDTRTYAHGLFQKTMATTSQSEIGALRSLAALMDTTGAGEAALPPLPASKMTSALGAGVGFHSANGELGMPDQSAGHGPRPFILFNPTVRERSEVIEAVVWESAVPDSKPLKERSFSVRHADGTLVAPQIVADGEFAWHRYVTLAFPVKVGGLGYTQFHILEEPKAEAPKTPEPEVRQIGWVHHCSYAPVERSAEGLENDAVRFELDPVTGGIRSLLDKRSGLTLMHFSEGASTVEYAVELPHTMTAWSIDHAGPVEKPHVTAIRRGLTGPYKASLEVDFRIHESTFTLIYELRSGDPKLYLHLKGVWFQRGSRETGIPVLRLAFPFALADGQGRYEIPFGALDRPFNAGEEVPALQWVQVAGRCGGKKAGCLLLNDSKHGHSLDGHTLRLTLIRSSYDPDILPEIGEHEVHVALMPFTGELSPAEAVHLGMEFNHAVRVIGTDVHKGLLPLGGKFVTVGPESIILSALKQAENGDALVVRLFNPADDNVNARIALDSRLLGPVTAACEVDLLERPLPTSTAQVVGSEVHVIAQAKAIVTLLVDISNNHLFLRGKSSV